MKIRNALRQTGLDVNATIELLLKQNGNDDDDVTNGVDACQLGNDDTNTLITKLAGIKLDDGVDDCNEKDKMSSASGKMKHRQKEKPSLKALNVKTPTLSRKVRMTA